MSATYTPGQALWSPKHQSSSPREVRSDRLWRETSFVPQPTESQLWKKQKPAAPPKPDSLRAPGLWRSTSYSQERPTKITHNKRSSRTLSRSLSPAPPSDRTRSWIDAVLPSYVGRSQHYRNSHSIWAEQMFQQRRQSTLQATWVDSVLPPYVSSGPYQTTHAVWEASFPATSQKQTTTDWAASVTPSYASSGLYRTTHSIWAEDMSQKSERQAILCWVDSILPGYVKAGSYRTSFSIWSEKAFSNGANVCWVDHLLPSYVTRSNDYCTTHAIWTKSLAGCARPLMSARSISTPALPTSPTHSGETCTSPSSAHFRIHQPTSFLHHRNTSQSSDHELKSLPRTVAFHPPGSLTRTGTSMTANEEPAPFASLLAPPTREQAINSLRTPASARFAQLQSPCLFHKRFDDAVNLDRVLEEIEEEQGLTSGRLVQTATSVREISKQLQRKPIKRAVRSIMIVTKARDNSLVSMTRDLALWLMSTPRYGKRVGVNVYVDAKLKNSKRFNADSIVAQNPAFATMLRYWDPDLCYSSPEKFDLVLTLGGDGTVLFTSFSLFQRIVPPVLAFGLGSLGFLTPFNFENYKNSLNKIMGDNGMRVNLRMRFTVTVFRAPSYDTPRSAKARRALPSPVDTSAMVEGEQFEVLNELVIDRGPSPYVSNLELYADDSLLTVVQADGCIFSTPTGSTAYSLSAGGPLTDPSIPGLVLTPICPHTLSFRPMVLSDQLCLKVCIPRDSRSTAYASFDGKHRVELRRGDCVRVEAGRYPFPTVTGDEGAGAEWFSSVRRALRWNTRGAMQKAFSSGSAKPTEAVDNARFEDDIEAYARAKVPVVPEEDEDDDDEEQDTLPEEEEWDIDFAPISSEVKESAGVSVVDSGIGTSETSSHCASPVKKVGINMMNANNGQSASMSEIMSKIGPI